ncbi:MAG TPA: hypothetical protein VEW05_07730 [Candidatus Polarisedimenticolia bacterium]|nr:hypothetical protein [Candidatus Polarisedimenticolia bacterium]
MLCEHYKETLIEAAASDVPASGDLREHLDGCAACRAAFEQERAFFGSIDAGLRLMANADVPASLLPRVRARLDAEGAPNRSWVTNWLVLASAAAVIATFFVARAVWHLVARQNPQSNYAQKSPSAPVIPPAQGLTQAREQSAKTNLLASPHSSVSTNSQQHGAQSARNAFPEVLVPRDQEVLLTEYAEQWRAHKRPLLLAQEFDATILAPLQVAPIQIDELDVKLLAEEKSQ